MSALSMRNLLFSYDAMFVIGNQAEACLWIAIGIGFLIGAWLRPTHRRRCALLFPVFIAFGISDLVEATTGAWWRPWWLLVWKGVCVLVFLCALVVYARERRTGATPVVPSPERNSTSD
ncbi:MAG: hypothetical protein H6819_07570 [Phycisphaerales bacterium]|nr:hypothetical protein [Phycisphaerales bacterium]MCB9857647.1 hypothetical protein [Phycisphaerales bacterium]